MSFDVAIVAAILAAQRICPVEELRRTVLLGELGLDGRLRPVRGILPATLAAQQAGFTRVIVPLRQAGEAELVEGIEVFGLPRSPNWLPFYKAFRCRLLSPSMWSVSRPASVLQESRWSAPAETSPDCQHPGIGCMGGRNGPE